MTDTKQYLTIADFAEAVGISKSAIYQRLQTSLSNYFVSEKGKKYISVKALKDIFGFTDEQIAEIQGIQGKFTGFTGENKEEFTGIQGEPVNDITGITGEIQGFTGLFTGDIQALKEKICADCTDFLEVVAERNGLLNEKKELEEELERLRSDNLILHDDNKDLRNDLRVSEILISEKEKQLRDKDNYILDLQSRFAESQKIASNAQHLQAIAEKKILELEDKQAQKPWWKFW